MDIWSMSVRPDDLMHYGVLGMHWGIRRFQPYPKDYTGDGREVGEARRIQKTYAKNIKSGKSVGDIHRNFMENENTKEVAKKKDIMDSVRKLHEVETEYYAAYDKAVNKIASDITKNGKLNYNNPAVKLRHEYATKKAGDDKEYYNFLMTDDVGWYDYADEVVMRKPSKYIKGKYKYSDYKTARDNTTKLTKKYANQLLGQLSDKSLKDIKRNTHAYLSDEKMDSLLAGAIERVADNYDLEEQIQKLKSRNK